MIAATVIWNYRWDRYQYFDRRTLVLTVEKRFHPWCAIRGLKPATKAKTQQGHKVQAQNILTPRPLHLHHPPPTPLVTT